MERGSFFLGTYLRSGTQNLIDFLAYSSRDYDWNIKYEQRTDVVILPKITTDINIVNLRHQKRSRKPEKQRLS